MGSGLTKYSPTSLLTSHNNPSETNYFSSQKFYSIITSYCPHVVLSLLSDQPLISPKSYVIPGACLLVDICGFTKFSGDLSQEGVSGIDKLRRITSLFLTKFIETIYYYYGDVIAFAGDALICYFGPIKEDHDDVTKCCLRAIQCGNELKLLQTGTLSAHVAIEYGQSSISFIGGYQNQWAYVYEGDCFPALDACINDAKLQQLVISSTLKSILNDIDLEKEQLSLTLLPSGNYLVRLKTTTTRFISQLDGGGQGYSQGYGYGDGYLNGTEEDDDQELIDEDNIHVMKALMAEQLRKNLLKQFNSQVISFVPQPIHTNLTQFIPSITKTTMNETLYHSSELREVVCMFVKLDSYQPNREQFSFHSLQHFYYSFQQVVYTLGGFIRQIVMDDKGCVCIAMWGVPSASHINNSNRCLLAAYHLAEYSLLQSIKLSIGITTGEVYCGRIGSSTRCDYAAVGPSINLSARLMSVAKGRILFDEITFYSIDKNISSQCFQQLPLIKLKGRAEPYQIYEFRSDKYPTLQTNQRRPSISGLTLELQNITQTWLRESTGTTQSVPHVTSGSYKGFGPGSGPGIGSGIGFGPGSELRSSLIQPFRFSTHMSSPIVLPPSALSGSMSPSNYSHGSGNGNGNGNEMTSETFLNEEILRNLRIALSQLNNLADEEIKLLYDEENFLDDDLIAMTEGKLLHSQLDISDTQTVPIIYVLGIPGTGKTEVTTQLSSYCYTENIRYIYMTLNDLHYQTEYGVIRLLFKRLLGLENFSDLMKQKTIITSLFFEVYPPTHPLPYLIEKFNNIKIILGLSWTPVELTIKSRFSKLVNLHRLNNGRSTRDMRPLGATDPSRSTRDLRSLGAMDPSRSTRDLRAVDSAESGLLSPDRSVGAVGGGGGGGGVGAGGSFRDVLMAKNSFFSLSRSLLSIGSEAEDHDKSPTSDTSQSVPTSSSPDKFLTVLLLIKQSIERIPPTAVIIDELQHCDNLSWAIILYLITHLHAPILFLFTITEPFSHQMRVSQSRIFASYDQDDDNNNTGYVGGLNRGVSSSKLSPFQSTYEPNIIEVQRKSKSAKRFIRSISSLDPTSPQDKLLHKNINKIKILNHLYNTSLSHILKIQLTGLKKRDVKQLLQNNLQNKYITNSLINIVTDLCEGNIYWCKAIIDFIIQFGEEEFSETFCSYTSTSSVSAISGSSPMSYSRYNSYEDESSQIISLENSDSILTNNEQKNENTFRSSISIPSKMNYTYPFVASAATSTSSITNPSSVVSPKGHIERINEEYSDNEPKLTTINTNVETSSPQLSTSANTELLVGDVILYRLITTMMDSMKYLEKEILKYASVLGVKFSSQLLFRIMANEFENEDDFRETLNSLTRQSFFVEHFSKLYRKAVPSPSHATSRSTTNLQSSSMDSLNSFNYSFLSHRMRDIVYNLIPWSDACRIHCLVAYHIEHLTFISSQSSTSLSSFSEILTFHYYIASTSSFTFTTNDLQALNQVMNTSIEYLAEETFANLSDSRPLILRKNFFLIPTPGTTTTRKSPVASTPMSTTIKGSQNSIQICCKMKSYQYSLLASALYFQLHEYSKAFGYLKYSAEKEAIRGILYHDRDYFLEIKRLLKNWMRLCQQYQESRQVNQNASINYRTSLAALLERYIQVCCLFEECGMNA